jgi:hypothetical protein
MGVAVDKFLKLAKVESSAADTSDSEPVTSDGSGLNPVDADAGSEDSDGDQDKNKSYNVDSVRSSFYEEFEKSGKGIGGPYVKELWSDFLICEDDSKSPGSIWKVPYSVDSRGLVSFGVWSQVKQQYVAATNPEQGYIMLAVKNNDDQNIAGKPHGFTPVVSDKGTCKACGKGPAAAIHKDSTGKPLPWKKPGSKVAASGVIVRFIGSAEAGPLSRLVWALADTTKPYGDVIYADPGWQEDKKKRYPLNTAARVRAAWSYISMSANQEPYTAEQVSKIEAAIKAAGAKFKIEFSDDSGK